MLLYNKEDSIACWLVLVSIQKIGSCCVPVKTSATTFFKYDEPHLAPPLFHLLYSFLLSCISTGDFFMGYEESKHPTIDRVTTTTSTDDVKHNDVAPGDTALANAALRYKIIALVTALMLPGTCLLVNTIF